MFAGRAASEIPASKKNRSAFVSWQIQFEGWIGAAIFMKAPVEKQELSKTTPFDSLEELFRDDLVRIDIRSIHRRHDSSVFCEGFHRGVCRLNRRECVVED